MSDERQFRAEARRSGMRTIRKVMPYLWPEGEPWVKRRVVAAIVALLIAKLVTVATPFFYKAAVDGLAQDAPTPAWALGAGAIGLTIAYGMARLMSVGFQQIRDAVFTRVGQRALRQLALETFTHIHQLSLRYHITRKTGGLSRIIERGVKGVDFLLRFLLFSIGPLILELVLTGIILAAVFDVWYLVVLIVTITLYVWFTFRVTEWRVKIRKEMNDQDTDANQKAIDSLLNFETVKYFGAEGREAARYDSAMERYEEAAVRTNISLTVLNFGQSFLITAGLVIVMVMAAVGVQNGQLTVGDFVLVNAYMIQITMPLNFLGTVYREIRQALVDMGEMFDLLEQPREIADKPGAKDLKIEGGRVEFDHVVFGYDEARPILKGVSLTVEPGQTVAIVGPSGSGKSTIGRLLFRFYDVKGGALRIDGQDVRDITQESLHQAIGVVPQDTVLFNDTIRYNIAYGRAGATVEEIEAAARAAKIHEFILSLPRRLRYDRRRARAEAVGRREAARRDRADDPEEPADPASRRGDLGPRHRDGAGDPVRAPRHGAWADRADHRAPALDHRRCGPDRGARSRGDRGGGDARDPSRAAGAVPLALAAAGGRGGGGGRLRVAAMFNGGYVRR